MSLRYADISHKQKIMDLWELCFPGERDFAAFFFNKIYRPENALICEDGGQITAMMHLIPFQMSVGGGSVPAGYIYGVGTHPDFRRRGLSSALMEQAFFEMHLRGVAISVLIPQEKWLFDFYRQYGFADVFRISRQTVKCEEAQASVTRPARAEDIENIAALYDQAMVGRNYIRRDAAHWRLIWEEAQLSGGDIMLCLDKANTVSAYAVYGEDGSAFEALGTAGGSAAAVKAALHRAGKKEGTLLCPADKFSGEPFGCARVIRADDCLRLIPAPSAPFIVGEDRLCPWNIGAGNADRTDARKIGPEELTRLILSPDTRLPPYMNLMHN